MGWEVQPEELRPGSWSERHRIVASHQLRSWGDDSNCRLSSTQRLPQRKEYGCRSGIGWVLVSKMDGINGGGVGIVHGFTRGSKLAN